MARKNFLINKDFQLKVASYITGVLILFVFIYPIIIYKIFDFIVSIVGEECAGSSIDILNSSRTTVLVAIMGLQLMFIIFVFILSLYLSHRIAGPIYKLSMTLKLSANGPLQKIIKFRKNDLFSEVQDEYNQMMTSVQIKLEDIESDIEKARQSKDMTSSKLELDKAIVKIKSF